MQVMRSIQRREIRTPALAPVRSWHCLDNPCGVSKARVEFSKMYQRRAWATRTHCGRDGGKNDSNGTERLGLSGTIRL
jgi:hypothetical protein